VSTSVTSPPPASNVDTGGPWLLLPHAAAVRVQITEMKRRDQTRIREPQGQGRRVTEPMNIFKPGGRAT
jgi:hypothetical protein